MGHDNILNHIGNTPLIQLKNESIAGKLESINPGGSIKDRIALGMIEAAERSGELAPGMQIVEATSGNTGVGISLIGNVKGYKVTIVMPEGMSEERKKIIHMLGANLVLTPYAEGVGGAVSKALELKEAYNAFMPNQFSNLNNVKVHFEHTAPEIWRQTKGKLDAFIVGIGSGGTIQGVGTYLKIQNPNIEIIAVEPANVSALLGHEPGLHKIEGIGDGFIPDILEPSIIDRIIEVSDEDAILTARELALSNSLLVGTSSGAHVWAAREYIRQNPDAFVVTIFPDRAERYFSTDLFTKPVDVSFNTPVFNL